MWACLTMCIVKLLQDCKRLQFRSDMYVTSMYLCAKLICIKVDTSLGTYQPTSFQGQKSETERILHSNHKNAKLEQKKLFLGYCWQDNHFFTPSMDVFFEIDSIQDRSFSSDFLTFLQILVAPRIKKDLATSSTPVLN